MIRLAGFGGILGGPALAIAYLAHPPSAPPETLASSFWISVHVGFMLSLLGGVFLLVALLARLVEADGGWMALVGYVLATISLIFVFGLDYAEVFIFPVLAVTHPEVVVQFGDGTSMPSLAFAFPATGVAFMIGFVLLSWALLRQGVVSRGVAGLTIVGTAIFTAGLSGLFPMIVVKLGAAVFGASLVCLGATLARRRT